MAEQHDTKGTERLLDVRRKGAPSPKGSVPPSSKLIVFCPAQGREVLLQRCSFCASGEGLVLNPADDSLNLRCSYSKAEPGPAKS
jgi:hypothetical protein